MQRLGLLACVAVIGLIAYAPDADAQRRDRGTVVFTQAAPQQTRAVVFAATAPAAAGTLVLPLGAAGDLEARAAALSADERAAVTRALAAAEFSYGARQSLSLRGIGGWNRIVIVGLGETTSMAVLQNIGAVLGRMLMEENGAVVVAATGLSAEQAAELATGMGIGEYRSDFYRTSGREETELGGATIVTETPAQAQDLYASRGRALVGAMAWVRDLSNEPANVVYPESFVQRAQAAFRGVEGVQIQVLNVPAMQRLGMGAILGVGRGSERPPRMLIVRYRGQGAPEGGPIVLAGKGITFDSGGISIKPAENMGDMKMDMSGAASVVGAVLALSRSRAPVNVVAIAALAENMPDGAAIRPGDVLTAMNGKTIEVINTDAEGRLVLADALSYAEARLSPEAVVDVATLTGAVRGALGDDYAGLFSRHDALADQLEAAGEAVGEPLWRLPLHESYAEDMRSTIADLRNTGGSGAGAGTGAHFIGEFVSRETPWAHIDIANMAYGAANDWKPAGSAGFGVRLLERFVRDYQPVPRGEPEN
ncbi:MAG: leucyl aminopeptidase [Hyphomonadaceae bacterium]|nr:leucyl aminopeptidase [Hyphomonadaceae bacterium]